MGTDWVPVGTARRWPMLPQPPPGEGERGPQREHSSVSPRRSPISPTTVLFSSADTPKSGQLVPWAAATEVLQVPASLLLVIPESNPPPLVDGPQAAGRDAEVLPGAHLPAQLRLDVGRLERERTQLAEECDALRARCLTAEASYRTATLKVGRGAGPVPALAKGLHAPCGVLPRLAAAQVTLLTEEVARLSQEVEKYTADEASAARLRDTLERECQRSAQLKDAVAALQRQVCTPPSSPLSSTVSRDCASPPTAPALCVAGRHRPQAT